LGTLDVGCGVEVAAGAPAPRMVQAEMVKNKHTMQPVNLIKRVEGIFVIQGEL
jgi:hypothetical protein